ncbi:hypothetical protein VB636_17190 [Paracoccus sp. APAP_BH8]|uniref:Uncharacterized protein n=1 Tax=Paracoccus pantotrophus TaxID=82367 RepID=A0AAE6NSY6_PARPN|nr:hypothetical protein [Paracoccus pantotrophus]QFG35749.1 hypothetical protein ESD82_06220 [Paracoccus pantotrophus]RDD96855.1 hypothetical protein DTW92_10555 [Paracoccus pantotrophus]RNI17364.1 hypothetical protein EB844_09460 [Paracoccus pantotrophus]WGR66848.1 hypothetical protein E3U24_16380 [Paracoccus pantotrophus]
MQGDYAPRRGSFPPKGDFSGQGSTGNPRPPVAFRLRPAREKIMKGIIAWLLGVPIFVIILLYLTGIF